MHRALSLGVTGTHLSRADSPPVDARVAELDAFVFVCSVIWSLLVLWRGVEGKRGTEEIRHDGPRRSVTFICISCSTTGIWKHQRWWHSWLRIRKELLEAAPRCGSEQRSANTAANAKFKTLHTAGQTISVVTGHLHRTQHKRKRRRLLLYEAWFTERGRRLDSALRAQDPNGSQAWLPRDTVTVKSTQDGASGTDRSGSAIVRHWVSHMLATPWTDWERNLLNTDKPATFKRHGQRAQMWDC